MDKERGERNKFISRSKKEKEKEKKKERDERNKRISCSKKKNVMIETNALVAVRKIT